MSDKDRADYERYKDCPDVTAYFYCKYMESEEEKKSLEKALTLAEAGINRKRFNSIKE